VQNSESQLQKFKEQVRRLRRQRDEEPLSDPAPDDKFWLWAFLIACGLLLVLIVIVSIIIHFKTESVLPTPPTPSGASSGSHKPAEHVADDPPSRLPERPLIEPPLEKAPVGLPATERQMAYVDGLVRRKGWSEKERDAEINKVLGYERSYRNLTKREASSLIDAWK
jgi:hypothetical protein